MVSRRALVSGASAMMIAGCAQARDPREEAIEQRFPPTGEFVATPSGRVHYDRRGRGPAVVLIHGASGNLRDFTFSFSNRLSAAGFTAIAVDRPGFGYSDRPAAKGEDPSVQAGMLADAMRRIGIERPIVLGHSYGGAVAAAWLTEHREALSGAVLLSAITYPWPAGDNLYHALASTSLFGPVINRLVLGRAARRGAGGALDWVFKPQSAPPGYAAFLGAELAARPTSFRANARDISNVNDYMRRISVQYDQTSSPVALVHGTEDSIVPANRHAQRFASVIAGAKVDLLPGIGHMPHHVAPDAVIAAIRDVASRGRG